MTSTLQRIHDFWLQQRLALIGVSRNPQHFSRKLYAELLRRGYDAIPVNPLAAEIDGRPCYASVRDIALPFSAATPGGALILTPPHATEAAVRACVTAGIARIWLHHGVGPGALSPLALAFCEANHLEVIPGFCPYMFLPDSALYHRLHGWVSKLAGNYPN